MSERDEAADLAMCEAATMEPWFADESYLVAGVDRNGIQLAKFDGPVGLEGDRNGNCRFTANARTASPTHEERTQ